VRDCKLESLGMQKHPSLPVESFSPLSKKGGVSGVS